MTPADLIVLAWIVFVAFVCVAAGVCKRHPACEPEINTWENDNGKTQI